MKNIVLIIISSLLIYSCNNDDPSSITNDINKRVVIIEDFDSFTSSTYVSDSIIEYFENKKLVKKDSYLRLSNNTPYINTHSTYEYNNDNFLTTIKVYTDINLTNHYRTIDFNYSENDDILNVVSNKFNPSNFSSTLSNKTTHYEYVLDTIKKYSIDHLNNDYREDLKTYITYGSLDSINSNNDWMYVFDSQNDLSAINCLGNNYDCNTTYNAQYVYGNNREALIDNLYGNKLNSFLLSAQLTYGIIENTKKQLDRALSIYPTPDRNNNVRIFNYVFDEDNRLIEVYTTGTYLAVNRVKYYY